MRCITSNCNNLSMNWENMFSGGKMEFQTHCEFCVYRRIFSNQATCEMKKLQVQVYIQ